jgi:hypothetical protein
VTVTIKHSDDIPSILDLWRTGHAAVAAESVANEASKIGTLRGGSVGHIADDMSTVIGKCHRLAHLRSLGIQEQHDAETYLMFGAGLDNEEQWVQTLSKGWKGVILREEEIPVVWTTSNGTQVTGRPDIVLCSEDKTPKLGIELKLVSSVWTANSVHYKLEPKTDHLVQAAHYMWRLGIPFKLVYSSRVNWLVPYNLKRTLADRYDVKMIEGKNGLEAWEIKPFIREYNLSFENGVLSYYTCGMPCPQATIITVEGIERYYEIVSKIPETKNLGPRPAQKNMLGERATYNPCDYCPLASVCDAYDNSSDYEYWLDQATLLFSTTG